VRLNRVLALAGVASRRACDEMIAAGRVQVGGQVVTDLGSRVGGTETAAAANGAGAAPKTKAASRIPEVLVDGKPVAVGTALAALTGGAALPAAAADSKQRAGGGRNAAAAGAAGAGAAGPFFYFAVNKPKGYVCSAVSALAGQTPAVDLLRPWLDEWERRARREAARVADVAAGQAAGGGGGGGSSSARRQQQQQQQQQWRDLNESSPAASDASSALPPRFFTVGRLDVATTGLLLLTNDGAWAQSVGHPSAGLTREYVAALRRPPTQQQLQTLATEGAVIDGARVVPLSVSAERLAGGGGGGGSGGGGGGRARRPAVRVVVGEGRNREVRRLVEAAGLELHALKRVRVGGYRMPSSLGLGGWVELGAEARAAVLRDPLAAAAREARRAAGVGVGVGGGGEGAGAGRGAQGAGFPALGRIGGGGGGGGRGGGAWRGG